MERLGAAIHTLREAEKIALGHDMKDCKLETFGLLSSFLKRNGDTIEAEEYRERCYLLRDTLTNYHQLAASARWSLRRSFTRWTAGLWTCSGIAAAYRLVAENGPFSDCFQKIENILVESLIPTGLENEEFRMKNQRSAPTGKANVELRGGIAVTGHQGERIYVYTADGRLAASWLSEGNDLRHFAPGMYLVKVGSQTMKVAVK